MGTEKQLNCIREATGPGDTALTTQPSAIHADFSLQEHISINSDGIRSEEQKSAFLSLLSLLYFILLLTPLVTPILSLPPSLVLCRLHPFEQERNQGTLIETLDKIKNFKLLGGFSPFLEEKGKQMSCLLSINNSVR